MPQRPRENTLLMYATAYGTLDAMKLLLNRGADPNLKNAFGATALMWSVSDPEKVKLLLAKEADPNARAKNNDSALLLAALHPDAAKSVKLLAARGADPTAITNFGVTIIAAGASAGNVDAVRLGLAKKVDMNAVTRLGTTALMDAAENGSVEVTKLLLDSGANPNAVSKPAENKVTNGTVTLGRLTALILAVSYSPPAVTKFAAGSWR